MKLFDINKNPSETVLIFNTALVSSGINIIKEEMKTISIEGTENLVFDFTNVDTIDSMGISFLVSIHKSTKKENSGFKIINIKTEIFSLMKALNLDTHLNLKEKKS